MGRTRSAGSSEIGAAIGSGCGASVKPKTTPNKRRATPGTDVTCFASLFRFCLGGDSLAPGAFIVSFTWKQQLIEDKISYVTAKLGPSGEVEAEVLSSEDAA